jgi:hypothetical protein
LAAEDKPDLGDDFDFVDYIHKMVSKNKLMFSELHPIHQVFHGPACSKAELLSIYPNVDDKIKEIQVDLQALVDDINLLAK